MIESFFKTVRDAEFKKIHDLRAGSWINVVDANLEDLARVCELTGLDLNDLRDSLDKYELPRIEAAGENLLLFVRYPSESEFGLYTETLTLILTNTFLVSIAISRSEIIEKILASTTNLATTQKAKLLLHILLKITQDYTNNIKKVRYSILDNERSMKIVNSDAIVHLTKNEEVLNQYYTALVPLRNLLQTVSAGRYVNFYEEDMDLLDDLMIAIRQSEDICQVNTKSIRSLRDSYQIIFTNDVNRTIKLLTALTIIFTIPTITASIYGMNVALPFQKSPHAFWVILLATALAAIIALWLFQRKRWL